MKIKSKKGQDIEVSSGVMSDLAFLLIIFFIIFAVFGVSRGFFIKLPKKDSRKVVHKDEIIKININNEGQYLYEENILTLLDKI